MNVLLVEDNPGDARLIEEMLKESTLPPVVLDRADSLAGGIESLQAVSYDLVLLDLGLPDSQGLDTLLQARERVPHLPIVVLTGFNDEEQSLQALQMGAQDYLVKGQIESAPPSRTIRYAIERKHVEERLREAVQELETQTSEMESFTYSVSHDLKEPLRTLEAFSRFLLEDYSDTLDEQGRDYLERLANASARLKNMIEELLTLSRLSRRPPELERVSVKEVVASIIAGNVFSIEERGDTVVVEGTLPDVLADLARVEQVFGNLIGNGLKFNRSSYRRSGSGVARRRTAGRRSRCATTASALRRSTTSASSASSSACTCVRTTRAPAPA